MKKLLCLLLFLAPLLPTTGCGDAAPVAVDFEPNLVFAYHMGQRTEQPMEQAMDEVALALDDLFGSPDAPKIPKYITDDDFLADLLDSEKLQKAAGPIAVAAPGAEADDAGGLYRKHCADCHGVTGNGRGPLAALVDPYPRDYRLGKFKFKSTPIGSKPTKEDISRLIKHGIAGTQMGVIAELTDDDIAALVDYVIYLSIRGEVERSLYMETMNLYFPDGDTLYNPALADSSDEKEQQAWEDQLYVLEDAVLRAAEYWAEASEEVEEIPERDPTVVPDTAAEVLVAMAAEGESPIKQSVTRGKDLFLSEKAACAKCHGKEGKGDGQTNDYDEWTKDWTQKFGLDPKDTEAQIPLIARGALPVRNAIPRNFAEGVYRGGSDPEQIYQRIALGIEGSPMPAAAIDDPEQIWDLVNFVRSLQVPVQEEEKTLGSTSVASN